VGKSHEKGIPEVAYMMPPKGNLNSLGGAFLSWTSINVQGLPNW
jgi:hypothetical protein